MFITVEGIEGCGKSTLLAGLSQRLRATGREIIVTREPGGTPTGDAIRRIFLEPTLRIAPLTEALMINAGRAQHVVETIGPALARGATVLCDRFVDSSLAYQGYGRGLDLAFLRSIAQAATGGLVPDCTVILDIPVTVSRERIRARHDHVDRLEAEGDDFHARVRNGYLELARQAPRYHVFDGTKTPETLVTEVLAVIERRVA